MCGSTKLRYKIDDFGVTIVWATETDEDLFTRVFRVPPDFMTKIGGANSGDAGADPFAENPTEPETPATSKTDIELLKENGVKFPEGASVKFNPSNSTLMVRNTPTNLDLIEAITMNIVGDGGSSDSDEDPFAAGAGGETKMLAPRKAEVHRPAPPAARPSWSSDRDQTRLWHESNYYKHRGATDETFIPLNRFWLDLATWDGKGGFLSPNFNACTSHANEALFCLAMLDLPFKAARPETKVDGSTLRVKAREPMLLFYKDTRKTQKIAPDAPVLVRQTFHRLDDRFRTVEGRQIENSITGDFLAGVPYGASLVVTNPSGAGRRIDALAQIPAGAIPLDGLAATPSSTHELKPYGVLNLRLAFYFPAAGEFPLYPLQVSEGDLVLARTPVRTLRATAEAPPVDANSWPALARDGTADAVLDRLRNDNLATLDLKQIRWRLRDAGFFRKAIAILRERLLYSPDVASFGFVHDSLPAVRDYLENTAISNRLGQWLDSPLLEIRPVTHRAWETLEFDPLVNPRAHRFADKERLTHEEAAEHYEAFLDLLAWKPQLSADDRLALTAHLLMQDRIAEALARFDTIDPAALTGRLAYDYLNAVVLFHRAQPEDARAIATRRANLPPGLWKERFAAIVAQADEILALQVPRKPEDAKPKEEAPSLDLALGADGKLMVKHHRIDKTLLQLFSVDLEVLFSKDPFLSGDSASLPGIRANETREVALQGAETAVELPEAFRQGNVLVAANSGGTRVLKVLDSKALEIVRQPAERTLQVFNTATRLPLPRSYVKVYTQGRDGTAIFHKDGYTDLRGKFDYLSHTGSELGEIRKIAVLISHPEKGARIEIFDL
jgi:tetratricopeptide (TPR) repeat protein